MEDYIAVNEWFAQNTPEFKQNYRTIRTFFSAGWMALFLAAALIASETHHNQIRDGAIAIGCLMGLMYFFGYPKAEKKAREKSLRNFHYGKHGVGSIGSFSMELHHNVLLHKSELGEGSLTLSLITEIAHTPDYVLIRRGYVAYPLPRAKITDGDLANFVRELESRLPPAPALLPQPPTEVIKNSFIGTSRRAFSAAALSGILAAATGFFSANCGCGTPKRMAVAISVLAIAVAIGFIDMGFGLRHRERSARANELNGNTSSEKRD